MVDTFTVFEAPHVLGVGNITIVVAVVEGPAGRFLCEYRALIQGARDRSFGGSLSFTASDSAKAIIADPAQFVVSLGLSQAKTVVERHLFSIRRRLPAFPAPIALSRADAAQPLLRLWLLRQFQSDLKSLATTSRVPSLRKYLQDVIRIGPIA